MNNYLIANKTLITIVLISVILRLFIATLPGFKIDVDAWFAWAIRLADQGLASFYSEDVWTNYTPGYLYILYLLGKINRLFLFDANTFYWILKFPSIFSEIILGLIFYNYSKKFLKNSLALLASGFIFFNPAFIFNSAIWGQIDGFLSLFMILSILFLSKNKLIYSGIFFALSLIIKPQALALAPLFIFYLLRNFSSKNISVFSFTFVVTFFALSFPFFPNNPIIGPINLLLKMVGDYRFTSLFAYNFWGIFGFWIDDQQFLFGLSYQHWGAILLLTFWLGLSFLFMKNRLGIFSFSALAALGFYFLPTRAHERYLFPAIPLLILAIIWLKNIRLILPITILSFILTLNMYYVYVYYNEFYLNLPKVLYNELIYSFAEKNGKLLSVFQTGLFLVITYLIIANDVKKTK